MPRPPIRGIARTTSIFLFLAVLVLIAPRASGQDYLTDLNRNLELVSDFLEEAAVAIEDCVTDLLTCLRNPEEFAARVDAANLGLEGVTANLSLMEAPAEHGGSHALLISGFDEVSMGLTLYSQGLRENDPSKLTLAAKVIRDGRADIQAAMSAITSVPSGDISLIAILTLAIIGAAGGMAVLLVILLRIVYRKRLDQIQKELATCPVCGEVLDRWETYKEKQIRKWQAEHLRSHRRDETDPPP